MGAASVSLTYVVRDDRGNTSIAVSLTDGPSQFLAAESVCPSNSDLEVI